TLQLVLRAEDPPLSEDLVLVGLLDRLLEDLGLAVVLAADEDVRDVALRRDRGDRNPLEHLVRVEAEVAILERPRLRLIEVDREVVQPALLLRDERPLLTGGKTG